MDKTKSITGAFASYIHRQNQKLAASTCCSKRRGVDALLLQQAMFLGGTVVHIGDDHIPYLSSQMMLSCSFVQFILR
jgi:hypothetical protein